MPTIQYPNHPNTDTAFVVQDDGTKNRALMTAPQDTSTLELPKNANSCKGYVTINGKKQRVVMTADVMGGGSGGTYTAGTGINITNNEISATDPVLMNNTTQTNSLSVGGTVSGVSSVLIGTGTASAIRDCVVIGYNAQSESGSVVIGAGASSTGGTAATPHIAIGRGAKTTGSLQKIQLGPGTNSDANTFKVANANGNFEIMSADGTVPTARLTKVNTTITLTAAGWSNGSQTVSVSGITSTGVVFVSPDPTDQADYTTAGIICTAQATDSLTFTCDTTPSSDIDVVVVQM